MFRPHRACVALALCAAVSATPAAAQTAREILTRASFGGQPSDVALKQVNAAQVVATNTLRNSPGDSEAQLMAATAVGYRAKLTGSRSEAVTARKLFERLVGTNPRNAEAQLALGAWHIGAVYRLGGFMARAALGGGKAPGLAALDRAVALGGNRAFYPGMAALLRLELDPGDARGRALAESAAKVQRAVAAVLVPLRAGDTQRVKALAAQHLPFGWLD
jgi:hypothetical protein